MNLTIDLHNLAVLLAWSGIAFMFGFWLVRSRTLIGFVLACVGALIVAVAAFSDRKPEHLMGAVVAGLVIVGLLVVSWALVQARARRVRVYRPSRAQRQANRVAEAAQAERNAPAVPVGRGRKTVRRVPSGGRGRYVVNQSRSRSRAASLK